MKGTRTLSVAVVMVAGFVRVGVAFTPVQLNSIEAQVGINQGAGSGTTDPNKTGLVAGQGQLIHVDATNKVITSQDVSLSAPAQEDSGKYLRNPIGRDGDLIEVGAGGKNEGNLHDQIDSEVLQLEGSPR